MIRKYDRFYIEVIYDNRERLNCPYCNSSNTLYNGIRNNKTRISCKDCKKLSSINCPS